MGDGRVGRAAVELLLKTEPEALVTLVTINERPWPDISLPQTCKQRSWASVSASGGHRVLQLERLDVLVLAWWPHLLKGDLLTVAPLILNTHPSYLPHGRGKDPNFWALAEGCPFGVTIHHVNEGIDEGDIAFQQVIPVSWEDNGRSLYEKAVNEMIALFSESLTKILYGEIPRKPQAADAASIHFQHELEPASRLVLDEVVTVRGLLNLLRARTFPPNPACRFTDGDDEFEVRIEIKRLS
jgi:methionyl-tRNA formyltransferase